MYVRSIPNLIGMKELLDSFVELYRKIKETAFKKVNILDNKNQGLKKSHDKLEEKMKFKREYIKETIKESSKTGIKIALVISGVLAAIVSMETAKIKDENSKTIDGKVIASSVETKIDEGVTSANKLKEMASQMGIEIEEGATSAIELEELTSKIGVDIEKAKRIVPDSQVTAATSLARINNLENIEIDYKGNMDDALDSLTAVKQIMNFFSHNKEFYENSAQICDWLKKILKGMEAKKEFKKDIEYSKERKFSNDQEVEDYEDFATLNVRNEYGVYRTIPNKLGRPSRLDLVRREVENLIKELEERKLSERRDIYQKADFERYPKMNFILGSFFV